MASTIYDGRARERVVCPNWEHIQEEELAALSLPYPDQCQQTIPEAGPHALYPTTAHDFEFGILDSNSSSLTDFYLTPVPNHWADLTGPSASEMWNLGQVLPPDDSLFSWDFGASLGSNVNMYGIDLSSPIFLHPSDGSWDLMDSFAGKYSCPVDERSPAQALSPTSTGSTDQPSPAPAASAEGNSSQASPATPTLTLPGTSSTSASQSPAAETEAGGVDGAPAKVFQCPVPSCRRKHRSKKSLVRHVYVLVDRGDPHHLAAAQAMGLKLIKKVCKWNCPYASYRADNVKRHEKGCEAAEHLRQAAAC